MHPSLQWVVDELDDWERRSLFRPARHVMLLPHGRCRIEGRTLLNFAANDYLGLATDRRLCLVDTDSAAGSTGSLASEVGSDPRELQTSSDPECTAGAGASPVVVGQSPWLDRLERDLADFEGTAAALVFSSGYAANLGTVAALAGPGDIVCCDRLNHASLIDGCRLSRARLRIFPHAEAAALRDLLQAEVDRHAPRRILVVTDGLFSMDGDVAPLVELCDVCDDFSAMLLVDEAHATGVLGLHGRGACEAAGVEQRVAVRIGTLSKSLGGQGGFVAGPQPLIDWLRHRVRTRFFSTALSPLCCAAACRALHILQTEPARRDRLASHARRVMEGLHAMGLRCPRPLAGPIIPIVIGEPAQAVELSARLEQEGLLVPAIRPPSVPPGSARLRISLSSAHADEDIDRLLVALQRHLAGRVRLGPAESSPPAESI